MFTEVEKEIQGDIDNVGNIFDIFLWRICVPVEDGTSKEKEQKIYEIFLHHICMCHNGRRHYKTEDPFQTAMFKMIFIKN